MGSIKVFIYSSGDINCFLRLGNDVIYVNPSGQGGYSIDNAVSYLNEHANERSVHLCGKYVGLALQAGGIKGAMADGKNYGPILVKNGFHVENTKGYSPMKGDVTVVDGNVYHK